MINFLTITLSSVNLSKTVKKCFCISESFNMKLNISHQFLDYKIICVNSQHEITNSKGDFVLKHRPGFKLCRDKNKLDFYEEIMLFESIGFTFLL